MKNNVLQRVSREYSEELDEWISYYPEQRIIDYKKLQVPTASENKLKSRLFSHLKSIGFKGDLSHQEYLTIPLLRTKKIPEIQDHIEELKKVYKRAKYLIRRPDFLCAKYGFVIEVDGPVHYKNQWRQFRDQTREAEYRAIGLECFTIENCDLYSPDFLKHFLAGISQFIKSKESDPGFFREYGNRRNVISRARAAVSKTSSSTFNLNIGSFQRGNAPKTSYPTIHNDPKITARIQFGGYRYTFK